MAGKSIKITRMGGDSRRTERQIATMVGLGLTKRHQTREIQDSPEVRGMLKKVEHLVRIEE